jgi:hypothetical protein
MFKQIQLGLLISCISASSYAYVVETNFTIENKTDLPMVVDVTQPDGTNPIEIVPAHQTRVMALSNDDHSGLLYQTSTAPFKIYAQTHRSGEDRTHVLSAQGRIAFYVGASLGNKYSFLNAVSASDGLSVDPIYSCRNGGYGTTFDNKIIIDGKPGNELKVTAFPSEVKCQGVKSSDLDDNHRRYQVSCFDGTSSVYWKDFEDQACNWFGYGSLCWSNFEYNNGREFIRTMINSNDFTDQDIKAQLDKKVCGTW